MAMASGNAGSGDETACGDILLPRPESDILLLYCTQCDWEKEAPGPACANVCSKCQARGLRFVRFTPGVEDEAARAVMQKYRDTKWRPRI